MKSMMDHSRSGSAFVLSAPLGLDLFPALLVCYFIQMGDSQSSHATRPANLQGHQSVPRLRSAPGRNRHQMGLSGPCAHSPSAQTQLRDRRPGLRNGGPVSQPLRPGSPSGGRALFAFPTDLFKRRV
jgi:hypothetical protein